MVHTGILFSDMKSRSHKCLMTFWTSTSYSDFRTDQTSRPWYQAWSSPNKEWERLPLRTPNNEWFIRSICYWRSIQAGNAYLSGHLVLSLLGLPFTPMVESIFPKLPVFSRHFTLNIPEYFLDFALWITIVGMLNMCMMKLHALRKCMVKLFCSILISGFSHYSVSWTIAVICQVIIDLLVKKKVKGYRDL